MILEKLYSANLIHPPKWLINSCQYLTVMGSISYGVSGDTSDVDIYGFCIPPKDIVFPPGEIVGFGRQIQRFDQWQQHHIKPPDGRNTTYDFQIFSIIRYFHLCMECNPNMIDSLFTPRRCVLHSTQVGELVRENRKLFLHKGAWHKFRGYAYTQIRKYNPNRRQKVKPLIEFQRSHAIPSSDIINRILRELSRRGLSHVIQQTRYNGNEIRETDSSKTS